MPNATERFWAKVDRSGGPDACWLWTGADDGGGYGSFWAGTRPMRAHLWLYRNEIGPIPEGLVLDHECHNASGCRLTARACPHRRCVNLRHIVVRTEQENVLRSPLTQASINRAKTHCKHGHLFDEANTYLSPQGWRFCKTCSRSAHLRHKRRVASQLVEV